MRLRQRGISKRFRSEDADLVILNTCHIREKAAEKVYSELGRIRLVREARRRRGRDSVIAVAGCVAQAEGEELARRAPAVDIVVGPQSYHRLPHLLEERDQEQRCHYRNRISSRGKVRDASGAEPARSAGCLSDDPGRLQQVLHILRRPLYQRRGILPARRDVLDEAKRFAGAA